MGEDVNTVSPTLGFIIKTIEHSGYILCHPPMKKLQHADHFKLQAEHLYYLFNFPLFLAKYILNLTIVGDVGGQKTLRSYWRNYFEKTDALIWVVDATDRLRIEDCKEELHALLQEEVCQ